MKRDSVPITEHGKTTTWRRWRGPRWLWPAVAIAIAAGVVGAVCGMLNTVR